jgi:hypothetical protein
VAPITRTSVKKRARRSKPGDDPAYKAFIRLLPCVVCHLNWPLSELAGLIVEHAVESGITRSECAHVGIRGLGQLCPDRETLPLCGVVHHREGPQSHHVLGKGFQAAHGINAGQLFVRLQVLYSQSLVGDSE